MISQSDLLRSRSQIDLVDKLGVPVVTLVPLVGARFRATAGEPTGYRGCFPIHSHRTCAEVFAEQREG